MNRRQKHQKQNRQKSNGKKEQNTATIANTNDGSEIGNGVEGTGTNAQAAPIVKMPLSKAKILAKEAELQVLIKEVMETSMKVANNAQEEWQYYVSVQNLLQTVVELERTIRPSLKKQSQASRLANIDSFYRWTEENGIKSDGVKVAEFPGYGLGLEATRDIKTDEQLFAIPRNLILSEEILDSDSTKAQFGVMTNLKLAYALILESLQPRSFWKPYIDLLPEKYNTVLYYSVAEMEQLRGSNALLPALRQCKSIARQYAFIKNCTLLKMHTASITPIGRKFKEYFTYDVYRWAVSTVMTRENLIPKKDANPEQPETIAALVPFWDMANHSHGAISSFYNAGTHEMESHAQFDFKKGEQIFIHYGDRSNADLLVHNGFINPNHPKDTVAIKLGLNSEDVLFDQRCHLLDLLAIPKSGELLVLLAPEFISPQLLAFVRVFNMNRDQLEHWTDSERARDLLHIDCALETELESKTWQYLQIRLKLLLRTFPTTLEEDEAQLADHRAGKASLNEIGATILEFRILEKRILQGALDYAEQRTKA